MTFDGEYAPAVSSAPYRATILASIVSAQMFSVDSDDLLTKAKVEAARYRGWKRLGRAERAEEHRRKARELVCAVPREPKHLGAHERILVELSK